MIASVQYNIYIIIYVLVYIFIYIICYVCTGCMKIFESNTFKAVKGTKILLKLKICYLTAI